MKFHDLVPILCAVVALRVHADPNEGAAKDADMRTWLIEEM
jgi:hypothetical protein